MREELTYGFIIFIGIVAVTVEVIVLVNVGLTEDIDRAGDGGYIGERS